MKSISKKIMCLLLVAFMLCTAALPIFAAEEQPASRTQMQAPKATTAPTIDGTKDESIYGTSYPFADSYGSVAYAWDEHYIYAYVEVTKDTTPNENYGWDTDRVNMFFDAAGDGNINATNRNDSSPYVQLGLSRYIIDNPINVWGNEGNDSFKHGWHYLDYSQESMIKGGGCAWPNPWYVNDTYFAMVGVDLDENDGYAYEVKIPNRTWIASEISASEKAGTSVEYKLGHTMFTEILIRDQEIHREEVYGEKIEGVLAFNSDSEAANTIGVDSSLCGAELKLVRANTPCADHSGISTTVSDNGDGTHSDSCPICFHAVSADSEPHSGGTATCTSKKECDECGAEYGEIVDHDYTAQRQTAEHLATPADGDTPATYYYCCRMCGKNDTTRTFEAFAPTRLELEAPKGTPTIDGTKDASYGTSYLINEGGAVNGAVSFAWDENYIYAYMVINDSTDADGDARDFWAADRVGWYLDLANKQTKGSNLNGGSVYYILDMSRKSKNTSGVCDAQYNVTTTSSRYRFDDKSTRETPASGMKSGSNAAWLNGYIDYFSYSTVGAKDNYIVELAVPNRSYIAAQKGYIEPSGTAVQFKEGHVIGTDIAIADEGGDKDTYYYLNTISEDSRDTSPAALGANLTLVKASQPCTTHSEETTFIDNGNGTHTEKCPICLHSVTDAPEEHTGGTADCTRGKTCEKCGAHYGETVAHDFTGKKTTRAYLASDATYDSPRMYFYSCTMCDLKSTETFAVGSPLARPDDGGADTETEPVETEPVETEPVETEPAETDTEAVDAADGSNKTIIIVASVVGGLVVVVGIAVAIAVPISKKKAKLKLPDDKNGEDSVK